MILSYDQRIMTGQYPVADLMGYRHTKDGQLVVEPEEAKTVRFIFLAFIQGYDYEQIAMILTQKKRSTLRGRQEWNGMMVANIMKNERRWGDLEARKSIVVDYKLGKVTAVLDEPEQKTDTISVPILQCEEPENIPLPDLQEQPENVQRPGSEVVEKGMLT